MENPLTSSATAPRSTNSGQHSAAVSTGTDRRLTDETKPAFKTTEFMAYVGILAAIFVAGLTSDDFGTSEVWLYATVLTFGYMVARGLGKSGARHRYTDEG